MHVVHAAHGGPGLDRAQAGRGYAASFAPALQRALASGKPVLLHCLIDQQAMMPTATLDSLRQQALRGAAYR